MRSKQPVAQILSIAALLIVVMIIIPTCARADVIAEWNQEAVRLATLPASRLSSTAQTRPMAIVQVSMHDAVNGITREYRTYLSPGPAPDGASPEAAAIAAAHHSLRSLFPTHAASLDAMFFASLAANGLSQTDPGIAYGQWAAAAVIAVRAGDGAASTQYNYTAPRAGQPGVWVPLTSSPALLPGWGRVTPWVLENNRQFMPPPPPGLRSHRYAIEYNETKTVGDKFSTTRTPEQTEIAAFWRASPTATWNQPLTSVIASRSLSISARARIYALVYLAEADASIVCWEAKYLYNHWRPESAIHRGDEDWNGLTDPDPAWEPLYPTPRHPEYPSGNPMNSGAMAAIMANAFGDNPGIPVSATINGITHQWATFSEGVDEVVDARVYSGIHFRSADQMGADAGVDIANYVWAHTLRPCGRGRRC
ncbi:MAG: vanadium-dependent haloperoxidase [Pyrinomonadaceae bacterium]